MLDERPILDTGWEADAGCRLIKLILVAGWPFLSSHPDWHSFSCHPE
jgi:hypothetical protein